MSKAARAQVNTKEVESFRQVLERTIGLCFEDDRRDRLAELLATRVFISQSPSIEHYLMHVAPLHDETAELAEQLTVGETYFFRDKGQFDALRAILQGVVAKDARSIRMVSAGCASGDEPYSLAMTALEELPHAQNWDVTIDAIDLNERVLKIARAGRYRAWGLRDTPTEIIGQYFTRIDNEFQLAEHVAKMVTFRHDNLANPREPLAPDSSVDVAFCRNVLMYLHPDVARKIVTMLARALRPGGFLFLGHAETLRNISHDFHLRNEHGAFFYERRETLREDPKRGVVFHAEGPNQLLSDAISLDATWFDAVKRSTQRIETLSRSLDAHPSRSPSGAGSHLPAKKTNPREESSRLRDARALMHRERFHDALQALGSPHLGETGLENNSESWLEESLLQGMLLVCTGQIAQAQSLCEEILRLDDLNASAHYISSICHESLGDLESSILHSQTACYLDKGFAMPHLQLGRLARRSRDLALAKRELSLALELLASEEPARILLFGGGFRSQALIRICEAELLACERVS